MRSTSFRLFFVALMGWLLYSQAANAHPHLMVWQSFGDSLKLQTDIVTAADVDWAVIERLIKWDPRSAEPGGHESRTNAYGDKLYRHFRQWRNTSDRLLREAGLVFFDAYPQDPRRWEWFVATWKRDVVYHKTAADSVAAALWEERYPALRADFLSSMQVMEQDKANLEFEELFDWKIRPAQLAAWKKTDSVPFDAAKWARELLELAEKYPSSTVSESAHFRSAANGIITVARRDSVNGPRVIDLLRDSKNASLRTMVSSDLAFSKAKREPLHMKFLSLDGREIDLAQLRGKVVLLDFGAYTWCGACKANEPYLLDAYQKYHQQGLEILSFALEMSPDDKAFVQNYVAAHGYTWPHFFEGKGLDNEWVRYFGFSGVPQIYLLDKRGLLVSTFARGPYIDPLVRRHLGLPPLENDSLLVSPQYKKGDYRFSTAD